MLVRTEDITPTTRMSASDTLQTYCGLDCCVTLEVFEELLLTHPTPPQIYSFERALQAPYLEIMQRGFAVDQVARRHAAQALHERLLRLDRVLQQLALAAWGKPLNPRSPAQLKDFFFRHCGLPEVWISQKGERKLSTNREALEKLEVYLYARPIVSAILSIRDIGKQLDVLEGEIDSDGRFRTSYNIAGTECISGDSLVWTKGGLRTIADIYETPYAVQVWNGSGFFQPVRKVKYTDKSGFHLQLEYGYQLKCSGNHPVLTQRGFVEANALTLHDQVEINVGLTELFGQHALGKWSLISLMSEDLCEFIGMILADGSLNCNSEHHRCRLSNSEIKVQNRFLALAKNLFGVEGGQSGDEVWFSSIPVCNWIKSLGFPADSGLGSATIKTIPTELLRGKPNLLRALLRGLTLDSHQTEKGLMYGTQSLAMREQIQQILLSLGIISVKLQTGNSIKLNVPRSYCGRFLSVIGFTQQAKAESLARLLNLRSQWHEPENHGTKVFLQLKSIEPWQGDVFDLTMPADSPPQYVANGITVHNTGRPSSSTNAFGTGGNAQNIAPALRYVFVADPGWKLCVVDLEQVEARDVGWFCGVLFGDWSYLDSCEQGDLHTNNAKRVWPELPWVDEPKLDRQIANRIFYRDFTYRDMAKRGSHLSNYRGSPWMMARSLKIPQAVAEEFQARYLGPDGAFPCIPRWWEWIARQLQTTHQLVTPFGRRRHFFGRPGDDSTLREAIAFLPQSTTADRMNLGLWRVWSAMPQIQLLAQTYDSITFQYREEADEDQIIEQVLGLIKVELTEPGGRRYSVPGEAKIGWNWASASSQGDVDKALASGRKPPRLNTEGLIKWAVGKRDERKRAVGLARRMF